MSKTRERNYANYVLFFSGALCTLFTQFYLFTEVPGLHFDEAWQGFFAHRIASESGFWPLQAMNSYTMPVLHYFLAALFKIFGPSLMVMRSGFAAINFATTALFFALALRMRDFTTACFFLLVTAVLPLSVHNHRFYIEVTAFHGLCFALFSWGIFLWKKKPDLAWALIATSVFIGTASHILFIVTFVAGFFVTATLFEAEFNTTRFKNLVLVVSLSLLPLSIRMGLGLNKALPYLLSFGLVTLIIASRFYNAWRLFPKITPLFLKFIYIGSVPYLVSYVTLFWNGMWPYAQATGNLEKAWLPINLCFLFFLTQKKKGKFSVFFRVAFFTTFFTTSIFIFKQSPRYYGLASTLLCFWCAIEISEYLQKAAKNSIRLVYVFTFVFVAWNLFAFDRFYIKRFQDYGSTTIEFRWGPFHDNGRDFRPFQKAFSWLVSQNCQTEFNWVEDDRFQFPIEFLKLTAPKPQGNCKWSKNNLFFSHIPNYDLSLNNHRNEQNTAPPVENVKFLAHFPEWGDLAFWLRR